MKPVDAPQPRADRETSPYALHVRDILGAVEEGQHALDAAQTDRSREREFEFQPARRTLAVTVVAVVALLLLGAGAVAALLRSDSPIHGPAPAPAGAAASGDTGPEMQGLLDRTADSRLVVGRTSFAAAGPQTLSFRVLDASGAPIRQYAIEATKPLHLILVRSDLASFQHLHPTLDAAGTWHVRANFASEGTYRMYADFAPAGAGRRVLGTELHVGRDHPHTGLPTPTRTVTAGGDTVHLSATRFRPGATSTLSLHVVARDGSDVRDLQPYLGTFGHAVLVNATTMGYQHTHPTSTSRGPGIDFLVTLPDAGRYRGFVQYRHGGVLHTAAFTLVADPHAPAPSKDAATGMADMPGMQM